MVTGWLDREAGDRFSPVEVTKIEEVAKSE
jgi:hypothetical protein